MPKPNLPTILNTQSNDHIVTIETVPGVLSDNLAHIKKRLTRSWLVLSDVEAVPNEIEYNAHFKSIAFAVRHSKISKLTDHGFFLPAIDLALHVLENHKNKNIKSYAADNLSAMLALADGKPGLGMTRILNIAQLAEDNFSDMQDASRTLAARLMATEDAEKHLPTDFIESFKRNTHESPSKQKLHA